MEAIWQQAERFPDLLPLRPDTTLLDMRDGALAHAIYDAVMRRWLTLSAVLEAVGGKNVAKLEHVVQAALLGGAAQLVLLDRIPDHAALDETVEWVKRAGRPKAAGMVNAILRGLIRARGDRRDSWTGAPDEIPMPDGTAIGFKEPVLPEDEVLRLSAATSVPIETMRRWAGAFGVERATGLALHALTQPPAVVHVAYAQSDLIDEPGLTPHRSERHRLFSGEDGTLGELFERRPDLWVQDEASSEPVRLIAAMAPGYVPTMIVDLCAGQGTKTRQLAAEFPEAQILATDVDETRLKTLRRAFRTHERVTVLPHEEMLIEAIGRADLVLLDVPCSNTGVLPRRVEARYRAGESQLERMAEIQRQIVDDAVGMLTPEGLILYATCSLEREENEEVASWAGNKHGLRVVNEHRTWPMGVPGDPPGEYRDGSYGVVLTREVTGA
ncbi:MAG: 16S rRNA (cytosine967-C5)-methyltransferase [Phycisphaerales bacterium]|jgi:16S rRNA (cytosine967-C5)-methyltransferase